MATRLIPHTPTSDDPTFIPFTLAAGVLENIGTQVPAFNQWNIRVVMERIKNYLQANTPRIARDDYLVQYDRTAASDSQASATLETTSILLATMLTGSATRNIDQPGGTYEIHPKVPGGVLFIKGSSIRGKGGERIGFPTSMPAYRAGINTKAERGKVFSGNPADPHNPKHISTPTSSNNKYGGGSFVNFVLHHPGRPPDKILRDAYLSLASDSPPIDFSSATAQNVQEWLKQNIQLKTDGVPGVRSPLAPRPAVSIPSQKFSPESELKLMTIKGKILFNIDMDTPNPTQFMLPL